VPQTDGVPTVVDCHAHAVPESLLQEIAGAGGAGSFSAHRVEQGWQVRTPEGDDRLIREGMFRAERRAAMAGARGLDLQVLSPWMDLQPTAGMARAEARSWARRINETLAAEADDAGWCPVRPAFATVALDDGDAAADDLAEAVQDLRMAGLVLSTNPVHCEDLADKRLEPVWTAAEQLSVPVLLHPATDGPARLLPGSEGFGNAYCRLLDTTFGVAKLLLSGVLDRHPQLRLVTVHGGGFLPYQAMRLDGAHRADALSGYALERGTPSAYLRDLYYDTVAMSAPAIRFLTDAVGADRVLLGTDTPFPLGDQDPVGTVRAAGLTESDTAAVLGGTTTQLIAGGQRA
jgi:aminocarboxymuconate-semialdehyde decarboxylase